MDFEWSFFIDIGIVSIGLLLATAIRAKVRFFQRFLIPNALTAGFILLPFYNFLGPVLGLGQGGLKEIIYHLLSISFIAMMLRKTTSKKGKGSHGVMWFSAAATFQIGAQGFIGLGLTLILGATFVKGLFPAFGLFVPLGFALGPGQAASKGLGWELYGFAGASDVGLTFAAIGFLIACFVGVFIINHGVRKGWLGKAGRKEVLRDAGPGVHERGSKLPTGAKLTTDSDAIDTMSVNLGMVIGTYLLTFLFLRLVTWAAGLVGGDFGALLLEFAENLWTISFVFASLMALIVKSILSALKVDHILDNGGLTRISGTSVDLTVAAAVGGISLVIVGQYWVPIVIIAAFSGVFVVFMVPWMGSRLFANYRLHRTLILFGAMTGTLPTGLALLRVVDPDFETPVGSDYAYSSAIVFLILIPLILLMDQPAKAVAENNPGLVWITFVALAVYVLVGLVLYIVYAGRRSFRKAGKWWLSAGGEE